MKLDEFLWNFNNVPYHVDWFLPGSLPFQIQNVLDPNCMCDVNILDHHRTVYEFLALNNPPEIFN